MSTKVIALIFVISVSACSAQQFNINGDAGEIPTEETSQHFYVAGIGQERIIDAAEICGGADNIIKVESYTTFFNGLVSILTLGLYAPRSADVFCKQ